MRYREYVSPSHQKIIAIYEQALKQGFEACYGPTDEYPRRYRVTVEHVSAVEFGAIVRAAVTVRRDECRKGERR